MSRTLDEITADLRRVSDIYVQRTGIERGGDWYLLKIGEELGELTAEHLRQGARKPHKGMSAAEIEREVADEAADLLAQVLLFIDEEGIDIDSALDRKWFKYLNK